MTATIPSATRFARAVAAAIGLVGATVLAAAGPGTAAPPATPTATTQTARTAAPSADALNKAAQEHDQAVYDLLVLDKKLATTERRLAEAETERARLAAGLADATAVRDRTQHDLTTIRARLAFRLRATYTAGDLSWLDFLAGSADLTQLLNRAALLSRVLSSEAQLALEVDRARAGETQAEASLRVAAIAQAGVVGEARALHTHLEQARADQARLAARLGARLAGVQADARAAQARMDAINKQAGADPSPASDAGTNPGTDSGAVTTEAKPAAPRTGRQLTVQATAYALPGTTAIGVGVRYGIIAVDPRVIPLGTRLYVPGYGEGIAADTGEAVKGNRIDVWLPSEAQAQEWGVKTLTITILD